MGLRFLALACLVGAAFAGPVQRQSESRCAKTCNFPQHSKFNYEPGKCYVYSYRSENNITSAGIHKQDASLEATVELHFQSKCEGILKMKNIKIHQKMSQDDNERYIKQMELPLSYAFTDGKFENVCAHSEESSHSLNMKKGILSLFVMEMPNFEKPVQIQERDSLGTCDTKYTAQRNQGGYTVEKVKDLSSCSSKKVFFNFIEKKIPAVRSLKKNHLSCTQQIKDKMITDSQCEENQELKPPVGENTKGWMEFSGKMSMHLIETKPAEKQLWQYPLNQEDISYSIEESRQGDRNVKEVERVLKHICTHHKRTLGINIGKDFIKLTSLVRSLSYEELDPTYESLKNGRLCDSKQVRDIFTDTLPVADTDPAIKLMVKILLSNEATVLKAKYWPLSWALKQNPTKDTVEFVLPLLERDSLSTPVMIGVTSLVHRVCSSEDCSTIEAVNKVVKIYRRGLPSEDTKQILACLRAFGNMGYHGDAREDIIAMAKDTSKSKQIRLAAIASFRRTHTKRPQAFVQMYSDKNEDNEVRIELFRSILEHTDERQLKQIKRIAESETKEQVAGYVYTYIQNMNRTQAPRHQKLKGMLKGTRINPPKVDYHKNSKNIELSMNNKVVKIGASVEADLIHDDKTKIPVGFRHRMDVNVHGTDINILEWGLRTEDLEKIMQNLLAVKDKIPKFEKIRDRLAQKPTYEEFKEEFKDEFNALSPSKIFGDTRPELNMYFRTLDTEIFGISSSDWSRVREMVKFAELMSKLAHGEKADFSHSVVLANSKIVIPSVTGRSYSIDLVGTSTVGVTAEAKADLLKLPRSADIHVHFKPSVNLEFSTTVGIKSVAHKPDCKIVSRLHLEADVDARGQWKDGHVGKVTVTFPSETIAMGNISTNVYKIDEENNEKPIFEKMQDKVDHCLRHLHKPLGITACANVRVPKPFVSEKFPYVRPVGNVAITLKQSDGSFKSYELRLEIPKRAGSNMKFSASIDTPGSTTPRKFAANVEVKQNSEQKDVTMELVSPFKTVGGSGTFKKNDKHIEGSMELHTEKTEIASAKFNAKTLVSRSRKVYEAKAEYSIHKKPLVEIYGTATVIKGRKTHVILDFRANKSRSEPITLKATIMKEGIIDLSQTSEGKISSEVSFKSPIANFKISQTLGQQSKQSQSISGSLGLDYQWRGHQQESLTISGSTQRTSRKYNTNIKMQSTQYPRRNLHLIWNMQRDSEESISNDLKLTNGQKTPKLYIHLEQKSNMPKSGPGHSSVVIELPQHDIHYDLSVDHDINIEKRKVYLEADLCYKQDKHIKGSVDVEYKSIQPMKAKGSVKFSFPSGEFFYEDEIEEQTEGTYVGNSKIGYQKGKTIQLHYKYKQLSDVSKFHHEIEGSIQTPFSKSPINGKASFELNRESLAIVGQVGPQYSVKAHVKKNGVGHIHFKLPLAEAVIKTTEEGKKRSITCDLKMKTRRPRHIIGSVFADMGDKKRFEIKFQPDVEHKPEKKIVLLTVLENKQKGYVSVSKFHILDYISLSISEEGEHKLLGDLRCALEVSIKNKEPMAIKFERKTSAEHGAMKIEVSKNNVEKAKFELDTKLNEKEFSIEASLISPDHSFEDKHIYLKNQITHSGSSKSIKTSLSFKKKDNVYKTEFNSDIQPTGLEVTAQLQTPHENYEKNALGFSIRVSDNALSSAVNIDYQDNKKISLETELKTKNHACSFVGKLSTPYKKAKDVQFQITLDNHRREKSLESHLDINNARICDIQASLKKSSRESQIQVGIKVSDKEFSLKSEVKEEGDVISTTTSIVTPYKHLKEAKAHLSIEHHRNKRSLLSYVDANGERKGDIEISIASSSENIEVKGRMKTVHTQEISAHIKSEKTRESFSFSANVMKGTSPLLSTSLNRISFHGGEKLLMKTKRFEDTLLDLEISSDVSDEKSNKYSLKSKGMFDPISITFSNNKNDQNSVSTELRVCRGVQSSEKCYSLKSYHRYLINSGDYRFYEKVTMDLEKSVGGSYSRPLGKVHVLLTAAKNDYRSKVILEMNEKKLGYETKLHIRQHENDRCSFDTHVYLPQRTSRIRFSILHNHHRMSLEADAIPNTDDPSRKLSIEAKKEINSENKEVSGYIKVNHPRMSQPILLTCKVQPVGKYFAKVRLVAHTGPVWGKTLVFEVEPNLEQDSYGIRSMEYKLYTEDKSMNAYLKLISQRSRSERKIGFQWQYNERQGGTILTISRKTLTVKYSSPSAEYEVLGRVSENQDDFNLSLNGNGRKLKEIRISISDSCAYVTVTKSGPLIKSEICIGKREGEVLQLLKFDVQYRQHKCLLIKVGVNPEKPDYIDVVFKCNKDRQCQPMKDLKHYFKSLLQHHSLQEFRQDVHEKARKYWQHVHEKAMRYWQDVQEKARRYWQDVHEKARQYWQDVQEKVKPYKEDIMKKLRELERELVEPHLRKLKACIEDLKSKLHQHEKWVQEHIEKLKEVKEDILKRIKSAIPSSIREICEKFYQDCHRIANRYYKKVHRYSSQICESGTICNDIKSAVKNFDSKEIKNQIVSKIHQIKQSFNLRIPRIRIISPSEIVDYIRNSVHEIQGMIIQTFGRLIGTSIMDELRKLREKIETVCRQKAIDFIDGLIKRINNIFSQDEDLRKAQEMVLDAKNKIVSAWRNKEEIAENSVRRIEHNIKQNFRKVWDEKIKVEKYDPDQGEFRIKIRQPLSKEEIEDAKHGLYEILRKLKEHLRR